MAVCMGRVCVLMCVCVCVHVHVGVACTWHAILGLFLKFLVQWCHFWLHLVEQFLCVFGIWTLSSDEIFFHCE